ncbi:hypothetical protein F2Q68_00045158 [Brassica cretica]|uniref:C2H2-type domain-containing protein n=1 Tax=Brassica cretica TaxID=69181 RepID=A0A8S9LI52_BRACR|nr:hypothetical protein F2Q68_00045158 [Brassica cretica]
MESYYKCRFCFKSFFNGRALGGHMRSHMPFFWSEEESMITRVRYFSGNLVLKHCFPCMLLVTLRWISEVPLGFGLFTVHHRVGHPENFETPGIEVITGPLGQGIANAVGLPLAEKHLAARFNKPDAEVVDHYTYVILGDGCQKEGIFKRSCLSSWSLETWKAHCFLRAAIKEAKAVTDKSTLIKVTTVGYESPNKAKLMLCPWSCTCHWSRHTPEGSECPWI